MDRFLSNWANIPGVELLDYMVSLCLTLWETARLLSKVGVPFYILTSNVWKHWLLHILVSTWCYHLLNFSHSSRYVVVFHCVLICFNKQITQYACVLWPFYIFFWEVSTQILCPCLNCVACLSYWIISIWGHVLYQIYVLWIFSPSMWFAFSFY